MATMEDPGAYMRASAAEAPALAAPTFSSAAPVNPEEVFFAAGYTSPPTPTNRLSQAALWLTLLFFFVPPLLFISAILGGVGMYRSQSLVGVGWREGLAALVISAVVGVLWVILWVQITVMLN
ncbi:MAG: hypothetical protein Q4C87_09350 [Actinomycetaceae bacterium]|nr:hypothetical protein [Actinomycetaceae bacterium]